MVHETWQSKIHLILHRLQTIHNVRLHAQNCELQLPQSGCTLVFSQTIPGASLINFLQWEIREPPLLNIPWTFLSELRGVLSISRWIRWTLQLVLPLILVASMLSWESVPVTQSFFPVTLTHFHKCWRYVWHSVFLFLVYKHTFLFTHAQVFPCVWGKRSFHIL